MQEGKGLLNLKTQGPILRATLDDFLIISSSGEITTMFKPSGGKHTMKENDSNFRIYGEDELYRNVWLDATHIKCPVCGMRAEKNRSCSNCNWENNGAAEIPDGPNKMTLEEARKAYAEGQSIRDSSSVLTDQRTPAPEQRNCDEEEHISRLDSINNPKYNIEIYLNKEAMFKDPEDQTDTDTRVTFLPKAETDLMLGELQEELMDQGIYFSEFENELYSEEELDHAYNVLSKYKDRLPVLFGEIKTAYERGTYAIVNL